ncbi:MAG: hypothetical protein QM765_51000 [Myxococcales bacterium]
MPSPLSKVSRAAAHLRWLYMPLGLFALIAVGVHAGAMSAHDGLVVTFDWLDGLADRASTTVLTAVGALFGAEPATIDRWVMGAVGLIDLREREIMARWVAVLLELAADFVLALPALSYRERQAAELKAEASRQARLAELVQQKLAEKHPDARPVPRGDVLKVLLHSAVTDPTLLRIGMPLATACAVLAGACRCASELQAISFGVFAKVLSAKAAGDAGQAMGLFILGAMLVSLGLRAAMQALWWANRVAETDRKERVGGLKRRMRGWVRLGIAGPLALGAALFGAPVLSFFR